MLNSKVFLVFPLSFLINVLQQFLLFYSLNTTFHSALWCISVGVHLCSAFHFIICMKVQFNEWKWCDSSRCQHFQVLCYLYHARGSFVSNAVYCSFIFILFSCLFLPPFLACSLSSSRLWTSCYPVFLRMACCMLIVIVIMSFDAIQSSVVCRLCTPGGCLEKTT